MTTSPEVGRGWQSLLAVAGHVEKESRQPACDCPAHAAKRRQLRQAFLAALSAHRTDSIPRRQQGKTITAVMRAASFLFTMWPRQVLRFILSQCGEAEGIRRIEEFLTIDHLNGVRVLHWEHGRPIVEQLNRPSGSDALFRDAASIICSHSSARPNNDEGTETSHGPS